MTNQLEIKLLSDNAILPSRDRLDAGYDIYSAETLILEPQEKAVIETGKIDAGYQGNLGINIKNDAQYSDAESIFYFDIENKICFEGDTIPVETYKINKGDKLAQLVIVPILTPELTEVDEFQTESERGESGFGSTGY